MEEIRHFLRRYPAVPKVFLGYDRTAFKGVENKGLRITFDQNIRFRQSKISFQGGTWGTDLLGSDTVLMEIKVPGAFPLWLCRILNRLEIYPTSFSKYGTIYSRYFAENLFGKGGAVSA